MIAEANVGLVTEQMNPHLAFHQKLHPQCKFYILSQEIQLSMDFCKIKPFSSFNSTRFYGLSSLLNIASRRSFLRRGISELKVKSRSTSLSISPRCCLPSFSLRTIYIPAPPHRSEFEKKREQKWGKMRKKGSKVELGGARREMCGKTSGQRIWGRKVWPRYKTLIATPTLASSEINCSSFKLKNWGHPVALLSVTLAVPMQFTTFSA